MRIAVMGSGGVGGYVGGRLAEVGEDVTFIARGAHLAALRSRGLRIESPLGDTALDAVRATDDPAAVGPVDLVIFAVKLGDTEAAAAAIAPLVGPRTLVVTLQNGIDSAALIGRHVPAAQVVPGTIQLSAAIGAPGRIVSPGGLHHIVVGARGGDPLVAAFVAACNRATGLTAEAVDDVETAVWRKFVMLAALSGITCLTRTAIGPVLAAPASADFLARLVAENLALAKAEGQPLEDDAAERLGERFAKLPPSMKSSMLVDLEAGKPLEVGWLSGRVSELGRRHGVPTPANDAVVAALAPHAAGDPAA